MFSSKPSSSSVVPQDQKIPSLFLAAVANYIRQSRPKTVDDVVHQDEVVTTLKKSMETGNLPHLLFYGPPGTGKTSTILAATYDLYGPDTKENPIFRRCVLELNASDERGIDVIRKKVKTFAASAAPEKPPNCPYPFPPYKIIILDEADSMTSDAQHALRRMMETYASVTRFCLICNYVTRIIEPITSRTAKFRFRPLQDDLVVKRLSDITSAEGFEASQEIFEKLVDISGGDLRKAITYLQSCFRLYGNHVEPHHIDEMSGNVPIERLENILERCRSTSSFKEIQDLVTDLMADGYPANQVLSQLHDLIIKIKDMGNDQKAIILTALAEADKALIDGAGEYLQILNVAAVINKQGTKDCI